MVERHMLTFPRIWDIVERFKPECNGKGWKVYENEDLISVGNEYHYFVWTRHLHPSTFQKVIMKTLIPLREGTFHKRVNISYMAWITSESVSKEILRAFLKYPKLSRRVAIYDISPIYKGESICFKINKTESIVFQEFERFLNKKYGIVFKHIYEIL